LRRFARRRTLRHDQPDRGGYYFAHFFIILPLVSMTEKPLPLPFSITEAVLGKPPLPLSAGRISEDREPS
jgi:hypothetical protein